MIACIKTVVGEDLIGELSTTLDGGFTLKNPFMVYLQAAGENKISVAMTPYLHFAAADEFTFKKEHVILQYAPSPELENNYRSLTGTGIVVAKPNISLV